MGIRATICNQNVSKLNMEETNSVLSWRECMWDITKNGSLPMRAPHMPTLYMLVQLGLLPAIPDNLSLPKIAEMWQ